MIEVLAFDADDTLWHDGREFVAAERRIADLVSPYADRDDFIATATRLHNIRVDLYGYGAKGYSLALVEALAEVFLDAVPSSLVASVADETRRLLDAPITLIPGVLASLDRLAPHFRLVMITTGDLLHQERKIARSGLIDRFDRVEIVSTKHADGYRRIFARIADNPEKIAMIGNSLQFDILPALEAGAWAIHVPAGDGGMAIDAPRYRRFATLVDATDWLSAGSDRTGSGR